MSVTPDLELFRSFAAATFADTCTITVPAGTGTLNGTTGDWVPDAPATVYDGPCRVRYPSITESDEMFGGTTQKKQRFVVVIPHDVDDIPIGARVTVTDSTDLQLLDRKLAVIAVRSRSFLVDRRLGCEEVG